MVVGHPLVGVGLERPRVGQRRPRQPEEVGDGVVGGLRLGEEVLGEQDVSCSDGNSDWAWRTWSA